MSLGFWLTSLVITVTPGTGVLYTVSTGVVRRRKASVAAAIGCTLGILRFTTWLRRVFAGSFAALGVKLVVTER